MKTAEISLPRQKEGGPIAKLFEMMPPPFKQAREFAVGVLEKIRNGIKNGAENVIGVADRQIRRSAR